MVPSTHEQGKDEYEDRDLSISSDADSDLSCSDTTDSDMDEDYISYRSRIKKSKGTTAVTL
jgi:hypothetical protein